MREQFSVTSLDLASTVISGNIATEGGGIYLETYSTFTIVNCTLSNNRATSGGGIFSKSTLLTLEECTVSDNNASYGGGITIGGETAQYDIVTLSNSVFSGNDAIYRGGGIYLGTEQATGIVTNSTVTGNNAENGGGIYTVPASNLSVSSSTISDNSVEFNGGGINMNGIVNISNSTITGNSASNYGGGIFTDSSTHATITSSTLFANSASIDGGSIFNWGNNDTSLRNTIVANSISSPNCGGVITDDGYNLQFGGTVFDSCGASIPIADPKLESLADNDGSTLTHALLYGSAAIDAGDDANCPSIDQRGIARPLDGDGNTIAVCDIGAFEFENTPTGSNVVVHLADAGTNTSPVEIMFTEINQSGTSSLLTNTTGPIVPSGFSLGNSPTYYDISTTATFSSLVTVCISYIPEEYTDTNNLHLLHYENDAWADVTTSNDTNNHFICGQVNSLSPFVVAEQVTIPYNFTGFFQPVDNLPKLNVAKAGSAIPVKFSLGGSFGLEIFSVGYPTSMQVTCGTTAEDAIEQTVTANSSGLTYNANTGQYTYVWKTVKSWAGTCRTLVVKLNDGTYHRANFKFK